VIQVIGAAFVLAAATTIGYAAARRFAARPRELRTLATALSMLATEIKYAATPLPNALSRIAHQLPQPINGLFQNTADVLVRGGGMTAGECWNTVLSELAPSTALKVQDLELLRQFGHTLGISDRDDQLNHIRLACSQLGSQEQIAAFEQGKNERLCKYLGVLAGLMIVILMF